MLAIGLLGERLVTKDVCTICSDDNDSTKGNYIENSGQYTGGKNTLHVYKRCLDLNVELPNVRGG